MGNVEESVTRDMNIDEFSERMKPGDPGRVRE